MQKNRKVKGFILIIIGASFWGISGSVADYLFTYQKVNPEWLVDIRLLVSGFLLLSYSGGILKEQVFKIWSSKNDAIALALFSIIGMLGVQYTYFATISESNAATATILQYLSPVFVLVYSAIKVKKMPYQNQVMAVVIAMVGTVMVVTNGHLGKLSITPSALFWGLGSAFTAAFYTVQPKTLLARFSSYVVVGWGMLIGGFFFSFVHQPWHFQGMWNMQTFTAVSFVIFFGTILGFLFYIESLRYLEPLETSILASFEPLSAVIVSVLWLHVRLEPVQLMGMLLIMVTVGVLSMLRPRRQP